MPDHEKLGNAESGSEETPEQKAQSEALQKMAQELEAPQVETEPTNSLPENFEDVLDNMELQKKMKMVSYGTTINELMDMASGGDGDEGIRQKYYPKWKDGDFKELLKRLGE